MFCERYDMKSVDKADFIGISTVQVKVLLFYLIYVCTLIKFATETELFFYTILFAVMILCYIC